MTSDWSEVRLGELVAIKHGFAFKGEHFVEQITPHRLVTPANFSIGGGFQAAKPKHYGGPIPAEYVLKRGDLVVTMTDLSRGADTLGYAAVVPETTGTGLASQPTCRIDSNQASRSDIAGVRALLDAHH